MMTETESLPQPEPQSGTAFRIELKVKHPGLRLDQILLQALREQASNRFLKFISRSEFKELFKRNRIRIEGKKEEAKPSSALEPGSTWVDILGYAQMA